MSEPVTSPASGAAKGRAPHRRNEQARLAVPHAADDLLAERGFAGVTMEGIAARAGVAKQTIYRWWPSKVEVLLALIGEAQHDQEMARVFHQRYLDPQRRAGQAMLARGVASGELPSGLDVDRALDMLCGPVHYRALVTGGPISPAFTDQLVDDVLVGGPGLPGGGPGRSRGCPG